MLLYRVTKIQTYEQPLTHHAWSTSSLLSSNSKPYYIIGLGNSDLTMKMKVEISACTKPNPAQGRVVA